MPRENFGINIPGSPTDKQNYETEYCACRFSSERLRRSHQILDREITLHPGGRYAAGRNKAVGFSRAERPGRMLLIAGQRRRLRTEEPHREPDGRVFLFLRTDDFWRDYQSMRSRGIMFVRGPKDEGYGTVAVFEDLYGDRWDLVEFKA